ncbi:linearmycin resistance ATP-binding protein LnrL-like [Folsomia candida]|uniref:linearmycin resistance ATP-binding protein LnrL-like n=1 Tax=Folsomia candida TaxID=158441 RepID=UPI001604F752|nr:linearmycin resistance ATP-binding protein LnrL-like [Folsomia candida]
MAVVQIRNGYKSYNSEGYVLRNLSMDVHRGEIYGLLGASGCGKTTLISCLVGLRQFDRGQFAVFGRPGGDVLGKLGGYMPQDISLQLFLTIEESLTYYGMIYGLKNQEIENRIKFLTKFLDLKSSRMNIGCLRRKLSYHNTSKLYIYYGRQNTIIANLYCYPICILYRPESSILYNTYACTNL